MPLRVTDDSQCRLIHDCVDGEHHLGVILTGGIDSSAPRLSVPYTTGCLASVALLVHDDEDCRPLNVVLRGERRIRVVDYIQQDPYLTGHIELLDDYAGLHAQRRTKQATLLFNQYLELVRQRYQTDIVGLSLPEDPTMASYLLASVLYLPQEMKQHWLESASAACRLDEELAYLNVECERLSIFHALSQRSHQVLVSPDARNYSALISEN